MSDLVTGEAVVLELRLAKLASRALGLVVDLALQGSAMIAFFVLLGSLAGSVDSAGLAAVGLTGSVAVLIGYPVVMETLTRGQTVGKVALGLRVVRDDGGPIRFRHALIRGLAQLVDFYLLLGAVALVTSLVSSRGKRVGDLLAGTVVVRERVPVRGGPGAQMPPPLAAWARDLQLAGLPDDLALAARQLLSRVHELNAAARRDMAVRLADAVVAVVSPPPPPGTPPEAYLAAVLAERRARETHRLTGNPPPGSYGVPAGPYRATPPPPYRAAAPPVPTGAAPAGAPPAPEPHREDEDRGRGFVPPS